MNAIPFHGLLVVSAILFSVGLLGIILRRNVLIVFMCIELMLNAANLSFVAFSKYWGKLSGEVSVFFIITVAAAESAVGLGLVVALFRTLRSVDTDDIRILRD